MRQTPPDDIKKAIHNLKKCSPVAKEMSAWFASRERSATVTKVRVAADRLKVRRNEVVGLFRTLDTLGVGKFKTGRRGHESRFEWKYDPKELGQTGTSST